MILKIKPGRFARDPQGNHSLHHSIYDGMSSSVMVGAGETYFTAFALFLKVTAAQVGLLSTLPPLLGSLAQLISVWINRRIKVCKPIILTGVILQACIWLPMLALVLIRPANALPPLLILLTLYYGAAHLAAPTWTRLMGDIVPARRRGRYFAHRNRLTSMMTLLALVTSGIILHFFNRLGHTWAGFLTIFVIALGARLNSAWHISKMHEPVVHVSEFEKPGTVVTTLLHSDARLLTFYFVLMQMSVSIASPFFAVYMLRDMQFTYVEFMANTGTAVLVQFVTLRMWGRAGDIFGHRLILVLTGMTIPLLPLLWVINDNFWYLILLQVLSGLSWGGFNLGMGNMLFDLVPAAQRVTYVAVHNVLVAAGVFAGGLIGISLIGVVPATTTWFGSHIAVTPLLSLFIISTLLRLLVTALFLRRIRDKGEVFRPRLRREFIFRLTRFNAFMGLMYDFVTETRPDKEKKAHD